MSRKKKQSIADVSFPGPAVQYATFGKRIREIRNRHKLSQEEFGKILGISKQILSLYELEHRSPRIEVVRRWAQTLNCSVDYLLGDDEAETTANLFWENNQGKPFCTIFRDVLYGELGLTTTDISRITGLSEYQINTISTRQLKVAPLCLAMRLTDALNIPLEVWSGSMKYSHAELSIQEYQIAKAYGKADEKDQRVIRTVLDI